MLKKAIMLGAAAGFALNTSAFAIETMSKNDQQKANQTSVQMKQDQKAGDMKSMKSGTTGSGATSADPRDSNAVKPDKSKTDAAKQKVGN
jgi:hypothetical protein